jgi:3-isopropylmalate/(R)-2-methylmalate dehydratase small subunit
MQKFLTLQSGLVAFPEENTDTDQIIPARFLKATGRTGFGKNLFYDRRYDSSGNPRPDFILNITSPDKNILLTGKNFGCGSSREHAAWALYDFGFRVVISESFADIFRNNALNNGLLTIELPAEVISLLFRQSASNPDLKLKVDLEKENICSVDGAIAPTAFHTDAYKRHCLINGLDDITYLTSIQEEIVRYEQSSKYLQFLSPLTHPA